MRVELPVRAAFDIAVNRINVDTNNSGNVFWVSNNSTNLPNNVAVGDDNVGDGSFLRPYATLAYAYSKCQAGRGDKVFAKMGHVETYSTAAALAMSTVGVTMQAVGFGAARAKIVFSATAATIAMSAASNQFINFIIAPSVNAIVSPFVVTAADCTIDVSSRDVSTSVGLVALILTSSAAKNLRVNLDHRGFLAGTAGISLVKLIGTVNTVVTGNFFGGSSTAVVEMLTTACVNVYCNVNCTNGTTALTKNVVDTQGSSTWFAEGYDGVGSYQYQGGNAAALSAVPVTSAAIVTDIAAALGTDGTTVTDSATTALGAIGANNSANAFSSASVSSNRPTGSVLEQLAFIRQFNGKGSGTVLATNKSIIDIMGYDGVTLTDNGVNNYSQYLALPRCFASTAKTLTTGTITIFTITGGPIHVLEIVGIVTTVVQSQTTSVKLQFASVSPGTTTDMSAAAVDLTGIAVGTSIRHINTTAILTPVTAGFVMEGNAFATQDTTYLCPAGTIFTNNASGSNTGQITWYLRYIPLSPLSRVA